MYKLERQIKLEDFVFPYGKLNPENDWIKLARLIDWDRIEERYAAGFENNGHPAHPARMALGALIIKQRLRCSDEWTVRHVSKNPYLQYFIGMKEYSENCPFGASTMVAFRKRFSEEDIAEILEMTIPIPKPEPPEDDDNPRGGEPPNGGTLIMDATCCPADIAYPQDINLLNETREKLEKTIDEIYGRHKSLFGYGDKSKWLTLPAHPEETQTILAEIGSNDGIFQILDCEAGFSGKLDSIILSANLNAVNYLASRLAKLSSANAELLDAILESPLRTEIIFSIERLIDFADNTGVYEIYRGVHTPEDLARHYIYHSGLIQIPTEWAEGIDLERFGKNLEKHEPGYYTRYGYLIATGLDWNPVFEQSSEVPASYQITP